MNIKRNTKNLIIILTAILLIAIAVGVTFSYWSGSGGDTAVDVGHVEIGTGNTTTKTVSITGSVSDAGGKKLVPKDVPVTDLIANEIQMVTLTFTVSFKDDSISDTSARLLNVVYSSVVINSVDYNKLFNVKFKRNGQEVTQYNNKYRVANNGTETVTAEVTMNMPSEAEYHLIAGQNAAITFNFSVDKNTTV